MSPALALALGGCLAAHAVAAGMLASPWWVPDLTLIGLVLVVVRMPHRWVIPSVVAGLSTAAWAIRSSSPIFIAYLLVGWVVQRVARQWDATDFRVQWLLVGIVATGLTFGLIWLDDVWSWSIIGLGLVRVAITMVSVPMVRFLMARVGLPAPFRA